MTAAPTVFGIFDGAATGMLDDADLAQVAEVIDAGSAAAILVYENSWAGPFATAFGERAANWSPTAGSRCRPCSPRSKRRSR